MTARQAAGVVARGLLVAFMILGFAGVALAYRADATVPSRTTYTASATQLVVTYGAGADSIDVNVRYPDGTTTNYHPNRSAAVGEVLTLPLTARPTWVQVHSTDCHLGETGSPGYGTDCRYVEEDPCPTETTAPAGPEPSPSSPPSQTPETTPAPETTEPGQPTPQPSTTPSPEPSTPTPSPTDTSTSSPSPTTEPSPGPSATPAPATEPPFDGTNGDPTDWPENYNQGDDEPAYTSAVSAVDERAATASPRVLAATGINLAPWWVGIAIAAIAVGAWLLHLIRPSKGDE